MGGGPEETGQWKETTTAVGGKGKDAEKAGIGRGGEPVSIGHVWY